MKVSEQTGMLWGHAFKSPDSSTLQWGVERDLLFLQAPLFRCKCQ